VVKKYNSIYFIGIAGVGMSALAVFAKNLGYKISGSDVDSEFITDKILKNENIQRNYGFNPKNIQDEIDLVIVGASFKEDNVELKEVKNKHITTLYYSEAIAELVTNMKTIAVSGVHGKTTTTALLAVLMEKAKVSPSYIIGSAEVPGLPSNAHVGTGEWFVVEADEYKKSPDDNTSKFLDLKPEILIISAIEWDHPDVFDSIDEVYRSFYKLACSVKRSGTIIANIDSPKVLKLHISLADRNFITYGFNNRANWQIVKWEENSEKSEFYLKINNQEFGPFTIAVPGKHNVYNATAALAAAFVTGIRLETLAKYLPEFSGVERRFQIKGEKNNILVIDDYAHHPTAITTTLETIKQKYPNRRIICVFQPHTFSRTKALLEDFAKSFSNADKVIIPDIFASAREKSSGIHSRHLVFKIKQFHPDVLYLSNLDEVEEYLEENIEPNDIIVTMGAGDIYKLGEKLLDQIK